MSMTREKAIEYLEWVRPKKPYTQDKKNLQISVDMAIRALKEETICPILSDDEVKQPCIKSPCGFERPHGEWISKNEKRYCSNCKKMAIYVPSLYGPSALLTDFCPNCGADMRKEGEAE